MRPPQYQRVLLWATASGPTTNRSADTMMMWIVNSRMAILLEKRGLSSSCGFLNPW